MKIMKYLKKYNKFNLQTKCRICLTQSITKMISLDEPLKGDSSTLVYQAIELVMTEKVKRGPKYPTSVCLMCFELLKISYDLKLKYRQSLKNLENQLRELKELSDDSDGDSEYEKKKDSVEILVGSQKFNIQDLLIVEEEDESENTYEGFLNNLGKTISATFVKKGYDKPRLTVESPTLVIEKVNQTVPKSSSIVQNSENTFNLFFEPIELNYDNQKMCIDEMNQRNDNIFIDTPVNEDIIKKFVVVTENDKEALESAMSLKYKCPFCLKPMASLKRVKTHSQFCGKNSLNTTCYICDETFNYRKLLLTHLKQVHLVGIKKLQALKEIDKHKCNICGKIFRSNGSLFYHINKHSGRRYGCDECDKKFYTRSQATLHRQTHNKSETKVICPVCGKGFHYRSGLFYHMKIHTNERNYQCSFCARKLFTRSSLKRHELTHTGGRPYDCKYCYKKFRSLGEVKKHILLHTGERPYRCKYCGLGFTQSHNFKMHLMTHSGNLQCRHCSKGFMEKEILRFHLRIKHKEIYKEKVTEEIPSIEQSECDIVGEDGFLSEEELILDGRGEFFITEEYIDEGGNEMPVVRTYEVRDEVLVETVEDNVE